MNLMPNCPGLFSYRKHWAYKFGTASFLPTSREEMLELGWDSCDIIIVTGDAYVDHPSFGMAIIGRLLEAQGFRVGIIDQPDWSNTDAFTELGEPKLFFGVTGGNMDSMVNRYTSDRRIRHNDAYTPDDQGGLRPDRAVIVYSQRCREAYKHVPIVVGGIEASLRRVAHYDYWSDKVRRSVLLDSKADILLYGNADRALVDVAHRIASGEAISTVTDVRGTAIATKHLPEEWNFIDSTTIDTPGTIDPRPSPYEEVPMSGGTEASKENQPSDGAKVLRFDPKPRRNRHQTALMMPSYEVLRDDPVLYAHASRVLHLETNPGNARALVQAHGDRYVWVNPPPVPLSTEEMDTVYALPFQRVAHPKYDGMRIPAYEMIKNSVQIMRGCFGGCTFCSITEHEGRIIQSRSEGSILKEIEEIRDRTPGFTGIISDLGGPTANMYRLACKSKDIETHCRRLSCVYPDVCSNLNTDHSPLISLYQKAREIPGIKKILIASGLRYDLAVRDKRYIKELVTHHVGGYLKIAPEHTEAGPLSKMMKPGIGTYDRFAQLFKQYSKAAGKEQYLIPYFIAAHPGTTDEDMMNLGLWLKRNGYRADQVQAFLPSPMALATAMYRSERNPLKGLKQQDKEHVPVPKGMRQRRLHKAFLRYHDPENWPMIREALRNMGRSELIGYGKVHLVPPTQPRGTGSSGGEGKRTGKKHQTQRFMTQRTGPAHHEKVSANSATKKKHRVLKSKKQSS